MYIQLSLPNGNTLNTDIVRSSYQFTECLYNDLAPVDNSVKCTVPYYVSLTNALQGFINDYIGAVVKDDDGTAIFTGYLRKQVTMQKATRNGDIAIELVPPSVLLNATYGTTSSFINQSMSTVLATLLASKLPNSTIVNCPDVTVQICKVEESSNVKTVITDLLFERGYTWTFNASGVFTCVKLFGMKPSTIGQTFSDGDSGNIYGTYQQNVNERQYDSISAEFSEIAYKENQTIFDDQSGKELTAGSYLFDSSDGGFLKYDCDGVQSVSYIESATVAITATGAYSHSFQNYYTQGKLVLQNTALVNNTINNIKVTGTGYFVTATSKSKTAEGKKQKEYTVKYLFDKTAVEALVKDINDYYRYSATKLTVKSKADYDLGSYCNVIAEGAGQYTARIIKKTHNATSDMITYELESVSSYTPAVVTTETVHESYTIPVTSFGASIPAIRLSTHAVSSFPAVITASCVASDGGTDKPYTAYIAVYLDGSTTPAYRSSNPEQSIRYTVPSGTETAVFRMETRDGSVYDEEKVVLIAESGITTVLDNGFQLFEPAGHGYATTVHGFNDGEEAETTIRGVSEGSGLSVTTSGSSAVVVPTGDVINDGEITLKAGVLTRVPFVLGMPDGTPVVIGIGGAVAGDNGETNENVVFKFGNYNIAAVEPGIVEESQKVIRTELIRNAYVGAISNASFVPQTPAVGDYWLCSGTMEGYDKGTIYICTGYNGTTPTWSEDTNTAHQQTAMADTFAILDSIGEENLANLFVKNLVASTAFINKLFAEVIKIKTGGSISSDNYSGTIGDDGSITEYGAVGFALGSDGSADFVNMHATNSYFEGNVRAEEGYFKGVLDVTEANIHGNARFDGEIFSGPIELSNDYAPGITKSFAPVDGKVNVMDIFSQMPVERTWTSGNDRTGLYKYYLSEKFSSGTFGSITFTYIKRTNYYSKNESTYRETIQFLSSTQAVLSEYSTSSRYSITSFYITTNDTVYFSTAEINSKIFKIKNIPTTQQASGSGIVWSDNGTLKIS